ncbi:hypothetical protein DEO72_LG5g2110 [Vigna unguiculata]|uniref:Uncharacterized protein n=1 Tax=Vigna unguiculata TaxID=3917 RepID=A0A4D6LYS0_VIGUN|nr:hypothetical protein DEO72_LG5g2110 [Vigna unguiculata]
MGIYTPQKQYGSSRNCRSIAHGFDESKVLRSLTPLLSLIDNYTGSGAQS